ncbi:uncharacterized protein LOC135463715 [Liolophura sinensis]|uniref:uncharacterized protein LOC135463715 n=1 Tax=Liolophura sinensis TaxID=3198878 RepID=UPI00315819DF
MGSGQSKNDSGPVNKNNNGQGLPVQNDRNDGRKKSPETTTTRSPQRNVINDSNEESQKHLTKDVRGDSKTDEKRENDMNENEGLVVRNSYDEVSNDNGNGRKNDSRWETDNVLTVKSKQTSPQKIRSVTKAESNNLVEFVESSDDESDTDSLLGIATGKFDKKKWGQSKSEQKAKAINLPLPAPSNQPNHSLVFEQERALNEYNILQGYARDSSPRKKAASSVSHTNAEDSMDAYPESYAQKLQRDQHRLNQALMIREKTIHRNPDEWALEESIVQGFDADRFKAANQRQVQQSQGVLEKSYVDNSPAEGPYNSKRSYGHRAHGTPSYNSEDEDLMNEIEREFDF